MVRVTRSEAKANTRAALLRSAAEVFVEKGFNAANVEDIAARAGFTRGAFYANFDDKADALLSVLDEARADDMDEIARLIESTPDDEKLQAMAGWYLRVVGDDALQRAVAELAARADHASEVRLRLARRLADTQSVIATSLRGYLDATGLTLPLDDASVAMIVLALGEGLGMVRHVDPAAVGDDLFTTAVAFMWAGLTADA